MAPLRYLDVLFGGNPGGLRGLDGGNSASLSTLQAAKVANILARANILAGGDIASSGYSKISAGVGKGSDLITIIKNTRSYDPYLIPPGIPGYNYHLKSLYKADLERHNISCKKHLLWCDNW